MRERLLGEELSVQQIVQVARFVRRKAEQTYRNAVTLYAASWRVADEAGRLAASAHAAAARVTRLRRVNSDARHEVDVFRGSSDRQPL